MTKEITFTVSYEKLESEAFFEELHKLAKKRKN